jgi:hypothetical protein
LIQQPSRDIPIVRRDDIAQDQFQGWIDSVTEILNRLEVINGNGSPEGVVFAAKGRIYFNNTGAAGTLMYVKNSDISLNTGWIAYA